MDLFRKLNDEGTTIVQVTQSETMRPTGAVSFSFEMAGWWTTSMGGRASGVLGIPVAA